MLRLAPFGLGSIRCRSCGYWRRTGAYMSDFGQDVKTLLTREIDGFKRELDLFADDESIWRTAPGVTNSAGNLALHVAGGLQYLVGTVLGRGHYVRDRDAEFSRRTGTRA